MAAEFANRTEIESWLQGKPREVAITFGVRAALRAVPLLGSSVRRSGLDVSGYEIILPVLRSVAGPWVAAKFPGRSEEIAPTILARIIVNTPRMAASRNVIAVASTARAAVATTVVANAVARAADAADTTARAVGDAASRGESNTARATGAYAAAYAATYAAVSEDSIAIDQRHTSPTDLAGQPLWPHGSLKWERENWTRLRSALLELNEDWEVWTEWYEARLEGRPVNEALEVARVMIANEIWDQGPKVVNAEIKRLIAEHSVLVIPGNHDLPPLDEDDFGSSVEAVPLQGPGPRFRATEDGPVDRAPPADLDAEGNDTKTIDRLRPLALRYAADLKTRLPPNQFGELLSAVDLYIAALDPGEGKTIEWGEVWGLGVYLQNASASAERKVDERILPALEDPAKTALESLLTLHGPLILATRDGARFSEAASNFKLTREQQDALRAAAQRVAEQLKADKEVITPRAAASVAQATETIGQGPHPERGSVYGLATVKNISIVLVGGAAIASPVLIGALLGSVAGALAGAPFSLVAVEAVKKSAVFNALVGQLGGKLDAMTDVELRAWLEERSRRYAPFRRFVARNAEPLRKIAEATPELRWMLRYIDFIAEKPERTTPLPSPPPQGGREQS